jgi:hypothetical protein
MKIRTKKTKRKRPNLDSIPLAQVLPIGSYFGTDMYMTMGEGQWDALLEEAYLTGVVLLEVDEDEVAVRAFQRRGSFRGSPGGGGEKSPRKSEEVQVDRSSDNAAN